MNKKYILVTGGLGYIGSNTVAILKKNKFDIIILDNLSNSNKTSLRNLRKILNKKIRNKKICFLGVTFNWGIIMAWAAINNDITAEIIILYISAIFWTLGYDTIYGAQDMSDDEIIGLKSTSIKFKNNIKPK